MPSSISYLINLQNYIDTSMFKKQFPTSRQWNKTEDKWLLKNVGNMGQRGKWEEICKKFNTHFGQNHKSRQQLEERLTLLKKNIKEKSEGKEWSQEQEKLLKEQYLSIGSRWTFISTLIPHKSESNIKNKFYGNIRKTLRKINCIYKNNVNRVNKVIKYAALTRILDIKDRPSSLPDKLSKDAFALREQIICFSFQELTEQNNQEVIDFCRNLFKFNLTSRCYKLKKSAHSRKPTECLPESQKKKIKNIQKVKIEQVEECSQPIKTQQNDRRYPRHLIPRPPGGHPFYQPQLYADPSMFYFNFYGQRTDGQVSPNLKKEQEQVIPFYAPIAHHPYLLTSNPPNMHFQYPYYQNMEVKEEQGINK